MGCSLMKFTHNSPTREAMRNKPLKPIPTIAACACGKRISANKKQCAKCAKKATDGLQTTGD